MELELSFHFGQIRWLCRSMLPIMVVLDRLIVLDIYVLDVAMLNAYDI